MDEIDESWEIFESFLSSQKVEKVYKDFQSCNCDCSKVIASNNLPVCTMCGLVESYFIDESPEWTSGVTEGGVSTDPSRCGNQATDLGLYSSSWGVGTIINTSYKTSYSLRRMARINFHTSMNHKDRSLFHAYKDIDEAAKQVLNISDAIVRDAKLMYRKFTGEKLTRGAVRLGIKANCVLYACKLGNK